ncbi:multidrug resistance protein MdtO [Nitrobacteraceae bacterium AZCC 2161]
MAAHVDSFRQQFRERLALLCPFPGRLEFSSRLALACTLTTLVAEIYQTPDPALTAYVAFFVMKRDRMESVIISIVLTILISLLVAMLMLIAMAVIDQPLWRVISITAASFGLLFLASASKLKPLAAIIALIVGYGLDLLSDAQAGELATRGYLYAWLFVTIPAAVSITLNLLLGPPPRRLLEQALAHRLALAASLMRTGDEKTREAFQETLSEGVTELKTWLKMAGIEKSSPRADIAALSQATDSITTILLLADFADRTQSETMPPPLRGQIADTLDEMASILRAGGYPVDVAIEHGEEDLPPVTTTLLANMKEALRRFTERPLPELPIVEPAKPGFFLADAFTNPDHVYYALKTTAAAMFCYATYLLLDWPGIHTCFITCYIVSLGTTAETIEKFTLRILGALIGAATGLAAIAFLLPHLTSIGSLLIVVFVASLVSAWVAAGSPRISYIGYQMAFAFFLCVIQGPSPAFDLTVARDRIIGIMLGNVVAYLIFTNIWPVTVIRRIDPGLVALLRRLVDLTNATSRSRRNSVATDVAGTMTAVSQDVELAAYESSRIGLPHLRLTARARAIHRMRALMGPLLLLSNEQSSATRAVAHRLDALANELSSESRLEEVTVPPSQNSLPTNIGKDPRDSYSVDGFVMADLEILESALRAPERGLEVNASV